MPNHIGSEPAAIAARRAGLFGDAKPSRKVRANFVARSWNRAGSRRHRPTKIRSARLRRKTAKRTTATSTARIAAAARILAKPPERGSPFAIARRKKKITEAPSKTRSRRIEASSGENGRFCERERRNGRSTSPTFPGRLFAAKPVAVAAKAGHTRTRATGRRIQVQRTARRKNTARETARLAASQGSEAPRIAGRV